MWGGRLLTAAGSRGILVFKEVWARAFRSSLCSLTPASLCLVRSAKDRKVWPPRTTHFLYLLSTDCLAQRKGSVKPGMCVCACACA